MAGSNTRVILVQFMFWRNLNRKVACGSMVSWAAHPWVAVFRNVGWYSGQSSNGIVIFGK
jgi:hypothetical protein